jgi:hypothetical protein
MPLFAGFSSISVPDTFNGSADMDEEFVDVKGQDYAKRALLSPQQDVIICC